MLTKEFLAPFFTFFGEHDRFRFAHRVEDHSLFVKASHCLPVVSFPSSSGIVECEKEKREHHLVDFVLIVFHSLILPFQRRSFNQDCKGKASNQALQATPDGAASSADADGAFCLGVPELSRSQ